MDPCLHNINTREKKTDHPMTQRRRKDHESHIADRSVLYLFEAAAEREEKKTHHQHFVVKRREKDTQKHNVGAV